MEETNMKSNTKKWIKAAAIRALKTVAQTAIAVLGTSMLISDVDWLTLLSASALSGLLSILTSVAGLPEVPKINESGEEINKGYDGEDGE
jgi:hypothetical protein